MPGDPNGLFPDGLEFKGMRTDQHGVSGAVFGPAGVDFPFRDADPQRRPMEDFVAEFEALKGEAAAVARHRPVNAHDAEEQLRPYLGRVLDADAALEGTLAHTPRHETALLDALDCYAEALDKALELLQVQR